jgi:galactokinase
LKIFCIAIYIAVAKREDTRIRLYANEYKENNESTLENLHPSKQQWANYILGVAAQLVKRGYAISGFNLVVDGDVPLGAGLSSSAAVECAVAFGLNEVFDLNIPKADLAEIGQKAEHEYAGVMCGIMDQFASVNGKAEHVIKLDCRSMEFEYVPIKMEGIRIVLFNTNVKHSLASTEYNTRRLQCEEGVAMVKKAYPQVHSLRDITMDMLNEQVPMQDKIYDRCKYVINENVRLLTGCADLQNGNLKALGKKMFQTHEGLSKDYEVSCKELDYLVNAVKENPSVLGARMMGGGFGGCTINLIREEFIESIGQSLSTAYLNEMGKELTTYIVQTSNGTSIVNNP